MPWLPRGAALPPGGAARGALERQQARFAREYALARGGALRVAPLEAAQEAVATELLTDSFADALGYSTPRCVRASRGDGRGPCERERALATSPRITHTPDASSRRCASLVDTHTRPVRRAYIREYLRSQRAWPPDGICLVGVYEDAATGEESIAATMTLSFTSETREDFTSLAPPEGSVYLCNMCTLRSLQRRGCAKAMLAAAGDFVEQMGCDEIWLHARLSDEKSVALYEGDGFKGVQTDGEQTFWDKMVTRGRDTRRVLMRKAA